MNKLIIDNFLNLVLLIVTIIFISFQFAVPLWHDEIYQLWIISKDFGSLISATKADPNYPLQSIIYKFFYDFTGSDNFENLVYIHFFSLLLVFFSFFLLTKVISLRKIIMLAIILFSSEYFLRFFFELRSYGFVFSWSLLFSSLYLITQSKSKNIYFILLFITGLVLSALHAIAGLFVVAVMLKFIVENKSVPKKLHAIFLIFISCSFVIVFSSKNVLSNNEFHIDSYYIHIRNTGAFMIPAIMSGILLFRDRRKKIFRKTIYDLTPIIFSMIIIFSYSIMTSPFYQGRYFTVFFPYLCLFIVKRLEVNNFILLKTICLIFIIFLYGPRAATPYTNLEGIIKNSHTIECNGIPLFFENEKGFDSNVVFKFEFDEIVFKTAEEYYSDIQRPVLSAKDTIKWWNDNHENTNCKVLGVTTRDIIPKIDYSPTVENKIIISKKLVDGCKEMNCGVIWFKD
jgi:hypothetical protein